MQLNSKTCAVFGVDIGKTLFHVVGLDASGAPIQKAKLRRDTVLQFFAEADPTLVGMEAYPGSQWLARKLRGSAMVFTSSRLSSSSPT